MGQTLTHGIYLPDEGERNCYAGLAANWQLLDGAVGTVAEHTSQIAGKAPAVHTHTKADITDFPVYGNTAGTICEGNDSRLSDDRTPVAHTHTKSDVTDLLNSNFIPSANSSYDLGSSAYIWSNVYTNTVNAANAVYTNTVWAQSVRAQGTSNALILAAMETWEDGARIFMFGKDNANGSTLYADVDHDDGSHSKTGITLGINGFYPSGVSRHLGLANTNYKWLSFNGVNPGALSLPDYNNVLDVTSEIPVASLDGNTQININDYLPNKTGWLSIVIDDTAGNSIIATQGRSGGSTEYNNSRTFHTGAQSNGFISVFFPILADMNKFVSIKASSLIQMRFYYCLGNV